MRDQATLERQNLRRLPLRSIAANYARHAPSTVGLLIGMYAYTTNTELWPGPFMLYLLGFLLALRVIQPPLDWFFFQYDAAAHHLVTRSGWISKTYRTLPWDSAAVLDVEEPWAYRPFGLSHISVRAGGTDEANLALEGCPRETTEFIKQKLANTPSTSDRLDQEFGGNDVASSARALSSESDEIGDALPEGELLYRASRRELVVACLTQGQFVILGGGVAYGLYEILDDLGFSESAMAFLGKAPLVSGFVVGLLILLLGVGSMLMKYHAFEVRNVGGRVYLAYGLFSRHVREIRPEGLVGLRLQRNVFEMLADRVRLSLMTKDSSEQLGSNLMLPSLPRPAVQAFMETMLASYPALNDHHKMQMTRQSGRRSFLRGAALLALVLGLVFFSLTRINSMWELPMWANFGLGGLVLVLAVQIVQLFTARLSGDRSTCHWKCSSVMDKELILSTPTIHFMDTVGTRREGFNIVKVHYFAGTGHTLSAITRGAHIRQDISAGITAVAPSIAEINLQRLARR